MEKTHERIESIVIIGLFYLLIILSILLLNSRADQMNKVEYQEQISSQIYN